METHTIAILIGIGTNREITSKEIQGIVDVLKGNIQFFLNDDETTNDGLCEVVEEGTEILSLKVL